MKKRILWRRMLGILLALVILAGGVLVTDSYEVMAATEIEIDGEKYMQYTIIENDINIDTGEIIASGAQKRIEGMIYDVYIPDSNGFEWYPNEQWQVTREFVYCDSETSFTVTEDRVINLYYKITYYDVSGMGGTYSSLEELYAAREAYNHTHSYTESITSSPTCTINGTKTFTCSCGDTYTENISPAGHSYGSYNYNNDATYDNDGTETATCSVCGAVDTRIAGGTRLERPTEHSHSYSSNVTTQVACVTNGTVTYTCSCGDNQTESIPATGHNYGTYVYNNDATYAKDGTETAICSNCGKADTRTATGTKLERETESVRETTAPTEPATKESVTAENITATTEVATTAEVNTEESTEETATESVTTAPAESEAATENTSSVETTEAPIEESTSATEGNSSEEVSDVVESDAIAVTEVETASIAVNVENKEPESNAGLIAGIIVAVVCIGAGIGVFLYKRKK